MNLDILISKVREDIEAFDKLLVHELDATSTKPATPKVSFLFLCYTEMLCHRLHDIAKAAVECYERHEFIPAAILVRAVQETVSLLFYTTRKVKELVDGGDCEAIHAFMGKPLLGTKFDYTKHVEITGVTTTPQRVDALQILNCIDYVRDNAHHDSRAIYDYLSDMAHPNQAGVGIHCQSRGHENAV